MTNYQSEQGANVPLTVGEWFVTMLVLAIPLIGLIMTFVWAFSDSSHKSRSNFCKAVLIWALIGAAIGILVTIIAGGLGFLASVL